MLGVTMNEHLGQMDDYLRDTAQAMGAGASWQPIPLGVYFGQPEVTRPDPYFDGRGPARTGCKLCGECLTGCLFGSKNSLDQNYLYLAEKLGVKIMAERKVTSIKASGRRGIRARGASSQPRPAQTDATRRKGHRGWWSARYAIAAVELSQ